MRWNDCLLRVCKGLGLFRLSRRLTARGLRILCYHGINPDDLRGFRPDIFLSKNEFELRLRHLHDGGYHVLGLIPALDQLSRGSLPCLPVVITFDDGYASFLSEAVPLLERYGYPATVYLNTADCLRGIPVYRLMLQYLFWKSSRTEVDLSGIAGRPTWTARLGTPQDRLAIAREIAASESLDASDGSRQATIAALAERLGVDCGPVCRDRALELMRPDEVSAAVRISGVDIQLHTHSHHFPVDRAVARTEIATNRRLIQQITGNIADHFCYPYGAWDIRHWPRLAEEDVSSATTCDPGMNDASTPRFALKRFVDGAAVSQLEFEAEMSGFTDMLRRWARAIRMPLVAIKRRVRGV